MSFQERFIFDGQDRGDVIANEHLVRYQFASKFVRNKKVLDIACGSGYGSAILAKAGAALVVGMDKDAEAVKIASAKDPLDNLIYKEGDATDIEARDAEFDVVVSFETIEHLQEQDKYAMELSRVVSDDGLVLVSTPNKQVFGGRNPFHVKELTKSEFEDVLKRVFPFVVCLEQENAVCSLLKSAGEDVLREVSVTSSGEPLYFLAVCSKRELTEKGFRGEGLASASVKAYERMRANPVLKVADKVYPLFAKLFKR